MTKHIHDHFKVTDPIIYEYIEKIPLEPLELPTNLFERLGRSIIGQQLSVKAAATIYRRLVELFPSGELDPAGLLALPDETMRGCGISGSKTKSLKDLATKVLDGTVDLNALHSLPEEEVIERLTKVRGIGRWTAEMFLMFSLGREDIFSHGDLGLKNAIQKMYGFKKPPTQKQIERIVKKWSPYKSHASRVLWRSLDNEPT